MSLRTLDISWLMITATWKTLGEGRKLSKLKGCNIWLRLRSILDSLTPWPGRSGGCPVNSVPGSTSTRSQKRYEEINVYIYIYIHFFHKLQFLWFCFLIFLSPSDAIYSSLLSLPLSWVAWVHWRHVSHEAPVAVQLQFLPEPPGVQAIGIGEGARKCKGEYDKKDQQRSKHMQDRQECTIAVRCILTLKQSCCMLKNSAARLIIVGFCSRLFKLTSCSFSNLLQRRAILIA